MNNVSSDRIHSFECEYKQDSDEWIKCKLDWKYVKNEINVCYDDRTKKLCPIYDSVFILNNLLYVECADGKLHPFRGVNLLPLIKKIVTNGLVAECMWIIPLMHHVAGNDESAWEELTQLMHEYKEQNTVKDAKINQFDQLVKCVRNKLIASDILTKSITAIANRRNKIYDLITADDMKLLTDDAKAYVAEVKLANDELWNLCLDIKTFAANLSTESKLNQMRIERWKKLKGITNNSKSAKKMKKGLEKIFSFGCNERMKEILSDINRHIAAVKRKFVILATQTSRLKTIDRENEEKAENMSMAAVGMGVFLAGLAGGSATAYFATAVVLSLSLSNPIGWIAVGAVVGVFSIAGLGFCGYKIYKKHQKNKKAKAAKRKNKNISQCEEKCAEFIKSVQQSDTDCLQIQKAMNDLSDLINERTQISDDLLDEENIDSDLLEELSNVFVQCMDQCNKLKNIIDDTQNNLIKTNHT